MKKLTWLFLSMMLVLGMGTAFAQSDEGGEDTPTTPEVPAPTFNPDGGTVVVYTKVILTNGTESDETQLAIYYNFEAEGNSNYFTDITTQTDLDAELAKAAAERKVNAYPKAGISMSKVQTTPVSAATAKINEDGSITWSTVVTKNFTVKAQGPSISTVAGAVASGTKITTTANSTKTKPLYFKVNGSDADFDLTYAQLEGEHTLTKYDKETENMPVITSDMTLKAAFAILDTLNETATWSVITTVEYTVVERPTAPTFSPDGGPVTETTQITLTNGTEDDESPLKIYYSRKGEASIFDTKSTVASLNSALTGITKSLWLYDEPLTTDKAVTIHAATAKIVGDKVIWSEPVTKNFTIGTVSAELVAPTFTPDGGDVEADEEITLETTTAGAKIYYCNGTTASFVNITTKEDLEEQVSGAYAMFFEYSPNARPKLSEFGVETPGAKLSLSAAAVLIAADGTLTWSDVITKEFTVKAGDEPEPDVAKPTITPGNDPGTARIGQMVTIECTTSDATIYYTTDKSEPTAQSIEYTEPFAITEDMIIMQTGVATPNGIVTVRAIAIKDGKESELTRGAWEIIPNAPSFSVTEEEVVAGTKVEIKCVPAAAKIYYTTNGTAPTEGSTVYTDSVEITSAMTLKAFAVLGQRTSSTTTVAYTIKGEDPVVEEKDTLPMPNFNPVGGEVEKGTAVVLGCDTANAKIYYTVNGEIPTVNSLEYTTAINIDSAMTIKAIAVKDGFVNSPMAEAAYTIKGEDPVVEEKDTLPMPNFNPVGGEVEKGTAVVLSCDTANAKIYYSINADTVTVNSLEYTTAISIDSAMTIKAIAVKDGFVTSKVAEASYTIKKELANEGKELAGVSVYPNPNSGMFYIELPVAATVDVFASNGVLVKSFTAHAGKATLSLDHSGIYFVRVASEGRATVKRVIVR